MDISFTFILLLSEIAEKRNHRFLVRLDGSEKWQRQLVSAFLAEKGYLNAVKIGGEEIEGATLLEFRQGGMLLGRECDCLFYDGIDGIDANSVTAASGALKGGGLLFLNYIATDSLSSEWLTDKLSKCITISEHSTPTEYPKGLETVSIIDSFSDQTRAIELIHKVVTGHRNRPLVLTADRGRGKSSALGIAAASLMSERSIRIALTAPSRKAVEPVFEHAISKLPDAQLVNKALITNGSSQLQFVSPDELIASDEKFDLLFVDEASAIPLPMLETLVSRYSRVVLSSTIHGYEGCGRGFTLKFYPWLDSNKPAWNRYHMSQAIRWNEDDPLERWIYDTFLLDSDIDVEKVQVTSKEHWQFSLLNKSDLICFPDLFQQCFGLLVNAHYQTSPNDLIQILDDDSIHLYTLFCDERICACVIAKVEGELSVELAKDIVAGKRRPRGHLAPSLIASQFGELDALYSRCLRVMRIAVLPAMQNQGMGTHILKLLEQRNDFSVDYIATSFGVTDELWIFWRSNSYLPLRLGSSCDHASGTHSILMVRPLKKVVWLDSVLQHFYPHFLSLLPESFKMLNAELVIAILKGAEHIDFLPSSSNINLVRLYATGGSSYESVFFILRPFLLARLAKSEDDCSSLMVSKLLQCRSWHDCTKLYGLSGRKQTERKLRDDVLRLL